MKNCILFVLILTFSMTAFGQDKSKADALPKPDFSGKWLLEQSKSKNVDFDLTLLVEHREPEMKVTKIYNFKGAKRTVEENYFTDGRAAADAEFGSDAISQKAVWRGGTLIRTKEVSKGSGKTVEQTTTENWELSKDGKMLTLTLTESVLVPTKTASLTSPQTNRSGTGQDETVRVFKFRRDQEGK